MDSQSEEKAKLDTFLDREDGKRVSSRTEIHSTPVSYFQQFFLLEGRRSFDLSNLPLRQLFMREANELIVLFSVDEVEQALRSLPNTKAQGPYDMHGIFLKKFWPFWKHDYESLY